MNLHNIYLDYKHQTEQKLSPDDVVFYNPANGDGFELSSIEDFENAIDIFKKKELIILNTEEINNKKIYNYFIMEKATESYLCVISHPFMSNAYWKDVPDVFLDSFISENQIYRYYVINYEYGMKDYIIEFPLELNSQIFNYLKNKMPDGFKYIKHEDLIISMVFTNTNRFLMSKSEDFVLYSLGDIHEEAIKKPTILNVSKKLFNDLKKIGDTKHGKDSHH